MHETLRLGHVFGVRVGVNWTVLVIFSLILVGLSTVQFPLLFEGISPAVAWTAGTVAAVVFFASLLAHELAHAIVARRNGLTVDGVVLWLFGGVALLRGEAPNPEADLRIAGVGPLVSFVIGVGFTTLALALGGTDAGVVVGVLGWLGLINIVLAVFNLVPAAPLDGGRILRALLWRARGDRTRAAVAAARAGRAFGFILVGFGLVQVLLLPGLGGIWLALIGWFLTTAARQEEEQALVQDQLGGLRVADLMTPTPVTVPPDVTIAAVVEDFVMRTRYSAFPVVDDRGRLTGLITLNRMRSLNAEQRRATYVSDVACERDEIVVAGPDESVTAVLPRLANSPDGRAVVVDEGRVIGILSPTDISRMLQLSDLWRPAAGGAR